MKSLRPQGLETCLEPELQVTELGPEPREAGGAANLRPARKHLDDTAVKGDGYYQTLSSQSTEAKRRALGTSLEVQWLGLRASTAGGLGSTPGQGPKIHPASHTVRPKKKGGDGALPPAVSTEHTGPTIPRRLRAPPSEVGCQEHHSFAEAGGTVRGAPISPPSASTIAATGPISRPPGPTPNPLNYFAVHFKVCPGCHTGD